MLFVVRSFHFVNLSRHTHTFHMFQCSIATDSCNDFSPTHRVNSAHVNTLNKSLEINRKKREKTESTIDVERSKMNEISKPKESMQKPMETLFEK